MSYALIKEKAHELFEQAHFITHIDNEEDYTEALALMDDLIEDYDQNKPLIEVLSLSIQKWEDQSEYFSEFNKDIKFLNNDTSLLKVLMSHHHLKGEDLKNEVGSKSLVSMILNGKRKLTTDHIQALSNRFNISPSLFFS